MTTVPLVFAWMLVFGQVINPPAVGVPFAVIRAAVKDQVAEPTEAAPAVVVNPPIAPRVFRSQRRFDLRGAGPLDSQMEMFGPEFGETEATADGLVVRVKAGAGRNAATGLALALPLESDFQITVGYELLSVDQPAAGAGAGVALEIITRPESGDGKSGAVHANLARVRASDGRALYTIEQLVSQTQGAPVGQRQTSAATGVKGRLRLQRAGTTLRYQTANEDGDTFTDLIQMPFTSDAVIQLRLVAQNGNSNAGVQVRLFDLVLESDRITEVGPTTQLIDQTQIAGRPTVSDGQHLLFETESGQRVVPFDEVATVKLAAEISVSKPATAPPAEAPKPAESTAYIVQLDGEDRVAGELIEITEDTLRLKSPHGDLSLPLTGVRGFRLAGAKPDELASFDRALRSPTTLDMLFVRSKEGKLADIQGTVTGLADGKLKVEYEGQVRSINQTRLVGLVLAARPPVQPSLEPFQVVWLAEDERLSGKLIALSDGQCEFRVGGHRQAKQIASVCKIARPAISQITFHNGRMIYLSDIAPVTVEETGYFGRGVPYRRDQNLAGGVLAIGSRPFAKGLAVQARTVLVYQLDAPFERFRATLGFDPAAGPQGRVRCRVLGDGRELFVVEDLHAVADPIEVEAPLAGVRRLALEVDFGVNEDVGDRLIWGDARIERTTDKTADSASR